MQSEEKNRDRVFQPIEDASLLAALTALGRSINLVVTYGDQHPAFKQAIESALAGMQTLFSDRKKIIIGSFHGTMTIDEVQVNAVGALLKSLERRLVRLNITGLRMVRGITENELSQLVELLASNDINEFHSSMNSVGLPHVSSEKTSYQAVHDGQTVANEEDLIGANNGILVLEDEFDSGGGSDEGDGDSSVHVDQIVAFLKGDLDVDESHVGEELSELATDPDRLGQMIMESVAIRQSATELSGESLNDIVLGCLRRTYDGLRKQPAFQSSEGVADLKKSLLLLEESMLDKIRNIAGEPDPELDRQIVQTIRGMNEGLGFQMAANQYMEHREAIEENKQQLQDYVRSNGEDVAKELISNRDFPSSDWRRIVVDSNDADSQGTHPPIAEGLNTLATVFEKLESLMKANETDGHQVKELLGQASDNLGDSIYSTKEKLETLSEQLYLEETTTGTIGGHADEMDRKELLSSISEIAQELMQPLTAINASLEMLLNGYVGEVGSEQRNLLSLASSSGDDLNYLMKELIKIVGFPINRGVDKRFAIPHE